MAALYDNILRRRAIIRRQALLAEIERLCADTAEGGEPPRGPVLTLFKETLAKGRAEIRRRFEGESEAGASLANDGAAVLAATSYLMDQLIRSLFDFVVERVYPAANPSMAEQIALVATGGYGRGQLAPQSDIDL